MVDHYLGVPKPSMGRRCFAPRGTDQQARRGETLFTVTNLSQMLKSGRLSLFLCVCHGIKKSKVRVSMVERSSDQIIKPINLDALTTWVGTYPEVSNSVQFGTLI